MLPCLALEILSKQGYQTLVKHLLGSQVLNNNNKKMALHSLNISLLGKFFYLEKRITTLEILSIK
jgi:hypothetical protein